MMTRKTMLQAWKEWISLDRYLGILTKIISETCIYGCEIQKNFIWWLTYWQIVRCHPKKEHKDVMMNEMADAHDQVSWCIIIIPWLLKNMLFNPYLAMYISAPIIQGDQGTHRWTQAGVLIACFCILPSFLCHVQNFVLWTCMFINVTVPGRPQAPGGAVQVGEGEQRIEGSFLNGKNQCCYWSKKPLFYYQVLQTLVANT